MSRIIFTVAFALGAAAIIWIGAGFVHGHAVAMSVTLCIGLVYVMGSLELMQFRRTTSELQRSLNALSSVPASLEGWLLSLPVSLQNTVRLRVEGERVALPGPLLTPYLVGLLVMLGMLGTFLGMVVTLNGAAFSLENTSDLEAIRSGLSAPIKGLGLAFGTSVAGVAASAVLGLLSTLSRRERLQAGQLLDGKIVSFLRTFSSAHNRQLVLSSLQQQTAAFPLVIEKLQAMSENMQRTHLDMAEKMLASQAQFSESVKSVYVELASSIDKTLKESLQQSSALAGESIKPVIADAMMVITRNANQNQESILQATQTQLAGVAEQFKHSTAELLSSWTRLLSEHERASLRITENISATMTGFNDKLGQLSGALLNDFTAVSATLVRDLAAADEQRLTHWQSELKSLSAELQQRWQAAAEASWSKQEVLVSTFGNSVGTVVEQVRSTSHEMFGEMTRVLRETEALVEQRQASEGKWLSTQAERIDQLTAALRSELSALRGVEEARSNAAVAQLGALQEAVKSHLISLGSALEEPLKNVIRTAAEAPRVAAEAIAEMREHAASVNSRDNQLLVERQQLIQQLDAVLAEVKTNASAQQGAIESLVQSTAEMLERLTEKFTQQVGNDTAQLTATAAELSSSSVEIASLSEAFSFAVQLFSESNEKLVDNLARVEAAMEKSASRSDEQLAYYVAQAREIIDLSMMSQREIFDELRQLTHRKEQAVAEVS
ncbi:MAG TPA: DUF802 domain-containing protein [Pseudomonadales bacterium]|nr:DUF802 domain-containing protein [Pseudomonadales bacterium]